MGKIIKHDKMSIGITCMHFYSQCEKKRRKNVTAERIVNTVKLSPVIN